MKAHKLQPGMTWEDKLITSVDLSYPHVSIGVCWAGSGIMTKGKVMRGRATFMWNEAVCVGGSVEEIVDADVSEVTGQLLD